MDHGPNPAGLTLFVLGLGIGLEAHILGVGIRQITCGTYIQSQQFGSATPRARTPPDVVYVNTFRSFFFKLVAAHRIELSFIVVPLIGCYGQVSGLALGH